MLADPRFSECVASSGPPEKIIRALTLSGLASFFGRHVSSSYVVGSWKPDPGLFLHAAEAMGFAPEQCVGIDDSEVGLQAAEAAGMKALHYAPESSIHKEPVRGRFTRMAQLADLIERFSHAA